MLSVVYRPTADLVPYERNARTHSEAQVDQIAASITAFGWTNPVLVDEAGGLIAGHGRLLAARALGHEQVPTICIPGLSDAARRALVIADNKLALNAGWDELILAAELDTLRGVGFDATLIGFTQDELNALVGTPNSGLTDPDSVPESPAEPVSALGDVWLLGRHRIVCGDCTDAGVVQAALGDVKPHLMVTDPPYGVEYDAVNARDTNVAHGAVLNDDRADWREAWALFQGEVAYVWHAGLRARQVVESLEAAGFVCRAQIIWDKTHLVMSRGHYHFQHEPCWYAVRGGGTAHWSGDRKQSTVWPIAHRKNETGHSTQKPVECMKRPIENNSNQGQAVYDPFVGSGTTIIAAEMTGRACHAIELSPAHVDVSVKRWAAFAGKTATLESTGQTFADVADDRLAVAA